MTTSLRTLGLDKTAVPVLKSFLVAQQRLQKLKKIHSSISGTSTTGESLLASTSQMVISGVGGPRPPAGAKVKTAKNSSSAYHQVRRLLDEQAWYPAHDKRQSSPAYVQAHKKLVQLHGCLICGVTKDIFDDKNKRQNLNLNPYGAKQLETHHHVIEWALANAIDPDKFNKLLLPHLKARHPQNPDYANPMDRKQIAAWVDHSEDNLWVLCDVHHRAKWFGIHEITDPIWGPQDIFDDGYLAHVREAVAATQPREQKKKGSTKKKGRTKKGRTKKG